MRALDGVSSLPAFVQSGSVTGDAALIQSQIVDWAARMRGARPFTSVDLGPITVTGTSQMAIPHGLGRYPQAVYQVRMTGAARTWYESQTADTTNIYLTFSGACVVTLRVE